MSRTFGVGFPFFFSGHTHNLCPICITPVANAFNPGRTVCKCPFDACYHTHTHTHTHTYVLCLIALMQIDNKHCVFGRVIDDGMLVIRKIENVATGKNNKPNLPCIITECGEY